MPSRGENAGWVSPKRFATGGAQIAARQSDVREHAVVLVGQPGEFTAMTDSNDNPPSTSYQGHRPSALTR